MHIVIDARIRQSSTGRYIDRLLQHLQIIDSKNLYTILLKPADNWKPTASNFSAKKCSFKPFSFNPLDQITFALFIHRLKPDIVHFGMTPQQPSFYRKTQVTTAHDLTMFDFARPGSVPAWVHAIRMQAYKYLFWRSMKSANRVLTPTEFVADEIAKKYPFTKDKTTVTLEASEPPLRKKEQKPRLDVDKFILYVGSAFPHKNLHKLVDAFEYISSKEPSLKLVIAGKKEKYYHKLDAHIKTKPYASKIITPGFASDAELKWLYSHARALVFPSLSEGFGLPPLEAMVHGCPVVSSNLSCMPEVCGNAAHYFDPNDASDITDKVLEVISNPKLRDELVKKGHKQAKKYSWRRMAKQTLAVYNDVMR